MACALWIQRKKIKSAYGKVLTANKAIANAPTPLREIRDIANTIRLNQVYESEP
jgi:hypothetical protein